VLQRCDELERSGNDRCRLCRELVLEGLGLGTERDVWGGVRNAAGGALGLDVAHARGDDLYKGRELGRHFAADAVWAERVLLRCMASSSCFYTALWLAWCRRSIARTRVMEEFLRSIIALVYTCA
jgi:hypothetical protein